jgi:hypothetical protein
VTWSTRRPERWSSLLPARRGVPLPRRTPGKAYEARGWELWAPLAPLYEAGEYTVVADRLAPLVAANPQYPMLSFNLACCESLTGRASDALDHLRHAVEMSEEFRRSARDDSDLDPIRDEPVFKQLIGG